METMTPLRAPWSPAAGSHEAKVMDFMWNHGLQGYSARIVDLHDDFYLIQGEAGPGHHLCPEVQAKLDRMDREIEEIVQTAVYRYDDWASDPLP